MSARGTSNRGTSNSNDRGSSESRRRRRQWLLATYASDCPGFCRCYRCGDLLNIDTVTVDRITPGCDGGTYRRSNIRPACSFCNSSTGGRTRSKKMRPSSARSSVTTLHQVV